MHLYVPMKILRSDFARELLKPDTEYPDDFCITGFDDFDKASYFEPRITTISYSRMDVAYQANGSAALGYGMEKMYRK